MPVHELFHELDALEFQYLGILPPSRVDVCLSDQQSGLWGFSPSRPTAASGRSIRGAAPLEAARCIVWRRAAIRRAMNIAVAEVPAAK